MKLFGKDSDETTKIIFFLGVPIYKVQKASGIVKRKYLAGIFKVKKNFYYKRFYLLGVKIYEKIDFIRYQEMQFDVVKNKIQKLESYNTFYHMQSMNKVKELALKLKIKSGEKIKVFFVIAQPSKFGMESVYKEMEASNLFEPYIYCTYYDYNINLDDSFKENGLNNLHFFQEKGYNVLYGYDEKTNEPIAIEKYNPDIVIINDPYLWRYSSFKNNVLNFNYLTCYIPYAMNIVENFKYHYNWPNINAMWKHFVPTHFDYINHITKGKYYGDNVCSLGYPKLDEYRKDEKDIKIPLKINNGKPIVIYAPHWSVKDLSNNISTFHIYAKYFLELLQRYPDVNFVFKPHPNLRLRIRQLIDDPEVMNLEEYDNYVAKWKNSPNGVVIEDANYIDIFRKSTALITDSGSFIGEYAFANKPCIYLVNNDTTHFGVVKDSFMDKYNEFGKKILETYYICYDQKDLDKCFEKHVLQAKDPNLEKRLEILKNDLPNVGNAGKNIVSYLTKILEKN